MGNYNFKNIINEKMGRTCVGRRTLDILRILVAANILNISNKQQNLYLAKCEIGQALKNKETD